MKKTQFKDTLRNIWKEKISFISIAIIALLAVAAYLGINFTSEAMRANADNFYHRNHFRDLEITSTMLLGEDDIESLSQLPEVADVEGIYIANGKVPKGSGRENVSVVSVSQRINTLEIVEGRLPEKKGECAIEKDLSTKTGMKIGETITVTDVHGDCPEYINENTFEITGIIYHPDLYALQNQTPGNRYIMVIPEVFNQDAFNDSYMKALVRIEKPQGISYFDKDYISLVSSAKESLEEWGKDREVKRRETFQEAAVEKLEDSKQELADAEKELEEGRKTLDEKQKELAEGEKLAKEGKDQLDAGKAELEKAEAELREGERELANGEGELKAAKAQLDEAASKLRSSKNVLDQSAEKLEEGKRELDEANKQLVDSYNAAEDAKEKERKEWKEIFREVVPELDVDSFNWAKPRYIAEAGDENLRIGDFKVFEDGPVLDLYYAVSGEAESRAYEIVKGTKYEKYYLDIKEYLKQDEVAQRIAARMTEIAGGIKQWEDGKTQYIKGQGEYNEAYSQYQTGLSQYNAGLEKYNQGLSEYNAGLEEYEAAGRKIEEGWDEYNAGKVTYDEKYAEYESKLQDLEKGRTAIKDGEEEYAKGLADFQKAQEEIRKAEQKINNIAQCHFVVLDTKGNAGFVYAHESATNMGKLGKTFALLFVLLGALVIYATVGRIIDEQRTLVGTQKALGFFSSEVFKKHLAFGVVGTCVGILAGIAAGRFLVEHIVLSANEQFYVMGAMPRVIGWNMAGISLALGIVLSGFAVFWACAHLLKETARDLMQPPAPKGRRKEEKKKGRGSIYSRLIIRNMLMDWRRVLVTMASVAGCCVLLVIGFTLKAGIMNAIDKQFNGITKYRDKISYDIESFESAEEDIEKVLKNRGVEYMKITYNYQTFSSPEGLTAADFMVLDSDRVDDFFRLSDIKTKEVLTLPNEGIVVTKRIAEVYDLSVGDRVTIYNSNMDPYETKVSGIFEYYLGKIMFISKEAYMELFGEAAVSNAFLTNGDYPQEELRSQLSEIKGFESFESTESTKTRFIDSTAPLQSINMLLILAAGMMAYFVLLNLINMYLNQKKKELTIMRVNGFTTKEVIRYIAGESILTTCMGIVIGLLIGSGLAYLILRSLEQVQFGMVREINLGAWLYSALLTGVFSLIINVIALRKVKHLKLSDIA